MMNSKVNPKLKIKEPRSQLLRRLSFWVIAAICIVGATIQIKDITEIYLRYETRSEVEVDREENIKLPSLSICYYMLGSYRKHFQADGTIRQRLRILQQEGHLTLDKLVTDCTAFGKPCGRQVTTINYMYICRVLNHYEARESWNIGLEHREKVKTVYDFIVHFPDGMHNGGALHIHSRTLPKTGKLTSLFLSLPRETNQSLNYLFLLLRHRTKWNPP